MQVATTQIQLAKLHACLLGGQVLFVEGEGQCPLRPIKHAKGADKDFDAAAVHVGVEHGRGTRLDQSADAKYRLGIDVAAVNGLLQRLKDGLVNVSASEGQLDGSAVIAQHEKEQVVGDGTDGGDPSTQRHFRLQQSLVNLANEMCSSKVGRHEADRVLR